MHTVLYLILHFNGKQNQHSISLEENINPVGTPKKRKQKRRYKQTVKRGLNGIHYNKVNSNKFKEEGTVNQEK